MIALTKLAERRRELAMSQEEFGEAIGVEAMTVSRWERGESLPHRKRWPKIEEITGVSMVEILRRSVQ